MLRYDRKRLSRWVIAALICALISYSFTFISLGDGTDTDAAATDTAVAAESEAVSGAVAPADEADEGTDGAALDDEKSEAAAADADGEPILTVGADASAAETGEAADDDAQAAVAEKAADEEAEKESDETVTTTGADDAEAAADNTFTVTVPATEDAEEAVLTFDITSVDDNEEDLNNVILGALSYVAHFDDVADNDPAFDAHYEAAVKAVRDASSGTAFAVIVPASEEGGAPDILEFDLEDSDSALEYTESYDQVLNNDPNFESHIETATKLVREDTPAYATIWALLPAVIAILLALITKEVYSSLFIGILSGGVIYAVGSGSFWGGVEKTVVHTFSDGFIASVADSYNIGIIIFLVLLGGLVAMMNKAGGSRAFGRWTTKHIKSRVGAQLMTILLGVLIFIDDYFNCLTVGSVMRPVTDEHKISRAKLAYLIDATAAPVCIIAPISSWAAAVAGFAKGAGAESGMSLFLRAIPFNFYAILTIVMMLFLAFTNFDYGPMRKHEKNAENGDLFTSGVEEKVEEMQGSDKGKVIDLILPVVVLIIACVIGMIYSGGFFDASEGNEAYHNFIEAFSNSDASVGLVYGSFAAIIFAVIYFLCRRVLNFKTVMEAIPDGFKAMVPAILILCCAWTLKTMTDSLGAKLFISRLVEGSAGTMQYFLPAIIFVIAVGLSFSTGTSWGTFGILIPIVLSVFGAGSGTITIVAISACMAGAVCGDHCSPISDTTIMASAGAQCNHINHVSTQLPYALTVAGVSFVSYLIAGVFSSIGVEYLSLPISIVLMIGTLFVVKMMKDKKA